MQDMTEHAQDAVVFDTGSGRILDTFISSTSQRPEIGAFYDTVLKPLGWTKLSDFVYVRENETLKMTFDTGGLVHFSLSPKGK